LSTAEVASRSVALVVGMIMGGRCENLSKMRAKLSVNSPFGARQIQLPETAKARIDQTNQRFMERS
jgi:hypothetical protein